MKRFRIVCIWIVLCMIVACTPQNATEAFATAAPSAETSVPTPKAEKEAALLYAGEQVNLYCARAEDSWGIVIEEFTWANKNCFYQPFPGTQGLKELTVTEIRTEADESFTEALFSIRYLDADGQQRVFCLDHPASDFPYFFPSSDEDGVSLTEDSKRRFEDAMLIGFLYADFQGDYAKQYPDRWEQQCQRRILDALFYNYEDALPPYLHGEDYDDDSGCCFVTQTELEGFFQSAVDRPNLVPDRVFEDEVDPDLLPGQVPMWPTDFIVFPKLRKAVRVSEGEYLLYGNVGMGEGWCPAGVICRVIAVDGYLGWRVVDTEVMKRAVDMRKAAARFVPTA